MVPTHLKDMIVKLDHLPPGRDENFKNLWNHHLVDVWKKSALNIIIPQMVIKFTPWDSNKIKEHQLEQISKVR